MYDKLPEERQAVEVCLNNREWTPATYQDGQFVDVYGLPLDGKKISSWRGLDGSTHRLH